MYEVTFHPLGLRASLRAGETLLDGARRAGAPIANSCGATGICARCRVRILSGSERVAAMTSVEARVAVERKLQADERLACQAIPRGDCTVTTGYW